MRRWRRRQRRSSATAAEERGETARRRRQRGGQLASGVVWSKRRGGAADDVGKQRRGSRPRRDLAPEARSKLAKEAAIALDSVKDLRSRSFPPPRHILARPRMSVSPAALSAAERVVASSLPPGAARAHLEAALRQLRARGEAPLLARLLARLEELPRGAAPVRVASARAALALACHAALLDLGLAPLPLTGGGGGGGGGAAMATAAAAPQCANDDLAPALLGQGLGLSAGWDSGAGLFSFHYAVPWLAPRTSLHVALLAVGARGLLLQARAERGEGQGAAELGSAEFNVDAPAFVAAPAAAEMAAAAAEPAPASGGGGGGGGASDALPVPITVGAVLPAPSARPWAERIAALLAPLGGADSAAGGQLVFMLRSKVVDVLLAPPPQPPPAQPAAAATASAGGGGRREERREERGGAGGGLFGVPSPLTGRAGDFEGDLVPGGGGLGAHPGLLIGGGGGGGGMGGFPGGAGGLVGPDHPIFGGGGGTGRFGPGGFPGGLGGPGVGPLPAGVPPGARFDPFGPGVALRGGRGGARGGRGGGAGGGGGGGGFGPNPDHLAPPPDEPPPDSMYW